MHVSRIRVRYGETDKMGVVYHANYLQYFEVGRTDLIRSLGAAYAALENDGLRLPVVEVGARFLLPARYDDVLLVETRVTDLSAVRVRFEYLVRREGEDGVLVEGHTVLASVNAAGRPARFPASIRDTLARSLTEDRPRKR